MAAMWGSNFIAIKHLVGVIDPMEVVLLRLTTASLLFGLVLLLTGRGLPRLTAAEWRRLAVIGFLGMSVNNIGVTFGTRMIPAALASLIVTTNPVFTAVLSWLILGEALTRRKLLGIAVAFLGFLVVLFFGGPHAAFSLHNSLGVLLTLLGPSSWAVYTIYSKPFLIRCPPTQFAGIVAILGTLPVLPLFLLRPHVVADLTRFGTTDWLAVLETAGLAMVVAYTIWYRGLRVLAPTQLAVYNYLVPVFGVVGAALFLGEHVTIFLLLGGLTILGGVVLTNTGRRAPLAAAPVTPQAEAEGVVSQGSRAGLEGTP